MANIPPPPADHTSPLQGARKLWKSEDKSTAIQQPRKNEPIPDFHMAIGMWAQLNGISDVAYGTLREVLKRTPRPPSVEQTCEDISNLLADVSTWKKMMKERLPLREVRTAPVALNTKKLPSARHKQADHANELTTQDLYFFNISKYI